LLHASEVDSFLLLKLSSTSRIKFLKNGTRNGFYRERKHMKKKLNMATGGGGGVPEKPPRKQSSPSPETKKSKK